MGEIIDYRSQMTAHANMEELRYREEVQRKSEDIEFFKAKIQKSGRLNLIPYLSEVLGIRIAGKILEIGAGMCWLSAAVSKLPEVQTIYALDFSERLLLDVAPEIFRFLGASPQKINRVLGDFHRLQFENESFDFVLADSALHHGTCLEDVLREVRRVLRPKGRLVAVREPVKPIIPYWSETLHRHELQKIGVTENHFSRREWKTAFRAVDWDVEFLPVVFSPGIRGVISRLLNGYLKSDFCLIAEK